MKNVARKSIVEIWILNKCVATTGWNDPFKFSFWWISRNLWIFIKYFAGKFFLGKFNFEQVCHYQKSEKTFQIHILVIQSNSSPRKKVNLCGSLEIFGLTCAVHRFGFTMEYADSERRSYGSRTHRIHQFGERRRIEK